MFRDPRTIVMVSVKERAMRALVKRNNAFATEIGEVPVDNGL